MIYSGAHLRDILMYYESKQSVIHSAWSESSAACPRPRGGHRKGENVARGAFATLQRRGPKGRADELIFGGVWSKTPNSSPRRFAIGCFQGNQCVTLLSPVLFRTVALQQTVLPPTRALILCAIARKSLIMTDFSKTVSSNMAETCAINFLTLVSYSTSIVIGGLSALVLPMLMWAGPDSENFAQNRQSAIFAFFPCLITHYRKIGKRRETVFGSLVVGWVLYWYSLEHLLYSTHFADRWRCKCAVRTLPRKHVQVGKFEHSSLPHRTS